MIAHCPTSQPWESLAELLAFRAEAHPHRPAVTFLADSGDTTRLTYRELYHRAAAVAQQLHRAGPAGSRAVLLFPPGIEFVVGFFACAQAGFVPAPACFPKPGRAMPRLDSVARDAQPTVLLADEQTLAGINRSRVAEQVNQIPWIATNGVPPADQAPHVAVTREMLGLLQYTSGSTSEPRGVMVSHGNLLANLEAIRRSFGIPFQSHEGEEAETGVFWLPAFHDMGLIGGILEPLYVGGHTVLMSPQSFLARPMRWLEAISQFGATTSGAPNFAYQLCVDRCPRDAVKQLDLSRWRLAFCGAEPIRAETLEEFSRTFAASGFSAEAFYPCYGLAESTLLAAGGDGPAAPHILDADRTLLAQGRMEAVPAHQAANPQRLVSCGHAVFGTTLRIVDPQSLRLCPEGTVGEIWLKGPSIAQGYYQRHQATEQHFGASTADGDGPFLRTGDLGAVVDGQLYVSGRLKDVIILRGRNLYPQDIEYTTLGALGEGAGQCAAFSIPGAFGEELCVVAEVPRGTEDDQLPVAAKTLRAAVAEHHEADIRHLRLVRLASVPLTSSGKVQRSACRQAVIDGSLRTRFSWDRSALTIDGQLVPPPVIPAGAPMAAVDAAASQIERWLLQWLVQRAGVSESDAVADRPFAEYGLDSLASVELSSELADWLSLDLTPVLAWNYPTPAKLAPYLARLLAGFSEAEPEAPVNTLGLSDMGDLEALLSEVEGLSDDEIANVFATQSLDPPRSTA